LDEDERIHAKIGRKRKVWKEIVTRKAGDEKKTVVGRKQPKRKRKKNHDLKKGS